MSHFVSEFILVRQAFQQHCEYVRTPRGMVLQPMASLGLDKWLVVFCDEINLPAQVRVPGTWYIFTRNLSPPPVLVVIHLHRMRLNNSASLFSIVCGISARQTNNLAALSLAYGYTILHYLQRRTSTAPSEWCRSFVSSRSRAASGERPTRPGSSSTGCSSSEPATPPQMQVRSATLHRVLLGAPRAVFMLFSRGYGTSGV